MKKVLVSGVQASGKIHVGNYFGAMRQNIELSNSGEFESYIFIADYHALNSTHDGEVLRENIYDLVASYIALGLDINKCAFFKQSDVISHVELSSIFNNVVTVPYMNRAHAFKDKEAKGEEVNVGLYTYPILMAADILMYQADIVPVGSDQKQHIEYARDIAGYFNRAYNKDIQLVTKRDEYFKLPNEYVVEGVATIPGIDGEKMSKSKNNHIIIFDDEVSLKKRIMSIVTDSKAPHESKDADSNNIFNIHKHFLNEEGKRALRARFENASLSNPYGYAEAKNDLLNTILEFRKGRLEIYHDLMNNREKIREILLVGAKKAKNRADITMNDVRDIIGLNI